jgi:hypothetical protein
MQDNESALPEHDVTELGEMGKRAQQRGLILLTAC